MINIQHTPMESSLSHWQTYLISKRGKMTNHFIGYDATLNSVLVSPAILEYDRSSKIGTTLSGRKYKLVGDPETQMKMLHPQMNEWLSFRKVDSKMITDVTSEFI